MAGSMATATVEIDAPPQAVWDVLVDPTAIKRYMFGTTVDTDWRAGSPIFWRGEYQGTTYEDRGEVRVVEPPRRLELTYLSSMSGRADRPESYDLLVYTLEPTDAGTRLSVSQHNQGGQDQAGDTQSNWEGVLAGLKAIAEERGAGERSAVAG